jgi:hypothetical protein
MFSVPDKSRIVNLNDADISDLPEFAQVRRHVDHPRVDDIRAATTTAIADISELQQLPDGAEVAVTAGSRGIANITTILRTIIDWLKDQDADPFILPAMGSHGGATAEGQEKVLAKLGITEESMGCEIRASMNVKQIDVGSSGHPIYVSKVALNADAILLANRVKIHTDFVNGKVESGLCKMAVIGLGKQRGAESAHNAATATSFREVLPEWGPKIAAETPVVGGLAIIENGSDETAAISGVSASNMLQREHEIFNRSLDMFPTLPVDNLDLLIIDEIGKHISGTGMDTNVVGRINIHGEPEPDTPAITRLYVRSLTERTEGNGLGIGLADFVHRDAVEAIDVEETYVNAITGSEPERARLPITVSDDETALLAAYSTAGLRSFQSMRIARITNTMEPNELLVSKPVVDELQGRSDIEIGPLEPLTFNNGEMIDSVGTENDELS